MKSCAALRFGGGRSFGSPGAGGAMGFADPDARVGYAYVTDKMGTRLTGDLRDIALRNAIYTAIGTGRRGGAGGGAPPHGARAAVAGWAQV
jgi:hypothetical protein